MSGLYWHTDWEAALKQATSSNKPILTLRLLGHLHEDYSCANSRFFRTALYSNQKVADYLRSNFVLHWKSVREIPVITIDMGDGKKIVQTITGNSCHYVTDKQGRLVDAIPGLYGAGMFAETLEKAEKLALQVADHDQQNYRLTVMQKHQAWLESLKKNYNSHLNALPESDSKKKVMEANALAASYISISKMEIEKPLFHVMGHDTPAEVEVWKEFSKVYTDKVKLDAASRALLKEKMKPQLSPVEAYRATQQTRAKAKSEEVVWNTISVFPQPSTVEAFEASMAMDTVMNEFDLHRRVHQKFTNVFMSFEDVDTFNQMVYAQLFLSPLNDPWLGLGNLNNYTALPNQGKITE